jgi:hypothetical protein
VAEPPVVGLACGVLAVLDAAAAALVCGAAAVLVAAAPTDDPLALQADSASPTPRPSAEKPAVLALRVKFRESIAVPFAVRWIGPN